MPHYDFRCPEGHVTEHQFTFEDVPQEIECPEPMFQHKWLEPAGHEWEACTCALTAERQISKGTLFIINKVMLPPSRRVKNYTLAKPSG